MLVGWWQGSKIMYFFWIFFLPCFLKRLKDLIDQTSIVVVVVYILIFMWVFRHFLNFFVGIFFHICERKRLVGFLMEKDKLVYGFLLKLFSWKFAYFLLFVVCCKLSCFCSVWVCNKGDAAGCQKKNCYFFSRSQFLNLCSQMYGCRILKLYFTLFSFCKFVMFSSSGRTMKCLGCCLHEGGGREGSKLLFENFELPFFYQ